MKKVVIVIALLLIYYTSFGQMAVSAGVNIYPHSSFELGISFKERIGVKVIAQSDWRRILHYLVKDENDVEKTIGKTYRLMYGGGLLVRVAKPVWVSINAGYGWKGKYIYDDSLQRMAVTNHVEGLDIGLDVKWVFSKYFYAYVGYETIPKGFRVNRPVNEIRVGCGMSIPL